MIAKLKEQIEEKKRELDALEAQLKSQTIHMEDIVPFAVFDFNPVCNDIVVMIPLPNGEFAMGGLHRDFKKFWADRNNRNGEHSFTQEEMLDKLRYLNATKSKRKIYMTDGDGW